MFEAYIRPRDYSRAIVAEKHTLKFCTGVMTKLILVSSTLGARIRIRFDRLALAKIATECLIGEAKHGVPGGR